MCIKVTVEHDFNIAAERTAVGGIGLLSRYVVCETEVLGQRVEVGVVRQFRHALGVL